MRTDAPNTPEAPFVNRRDVPNLRALSPRKNEGARIEIAVALTSVSSASGVRPLAACDEHS